VFLPDTSGVKLIISGKWFGKMRARKKILVYRSNQTQTIKVNTSYDNENVITKYGIFSLKLWIILYDRIRH
jgi:ribosomal protein S3